jgi:hypothetical protein
MEGHHWFSPSQMYKSFGTATSGESPRGSVLIVPEMTAVSVAALWFEE